MDLTKLANDLRKSVNFAAESDQHHDYEAIAVIKRRERSQKLIQQGQVSRETNLVLRRSDIDIIDGRGVTMIIIPIEL